MTHRLPFPGERNAYKRVKSDAAAARRDFTITLDWFIEHCHKPCHYCGRTDQNSLSIKSKSVKKGWIVKDFRYNGLDRLDNSKGYTEENCVPCCAICNRGKNSMGYNEFIEYIDTLINFRGELNNERDILDLSFHVERGRSETGNKINIEIPSGCYLSQNGTLWYEDGDGSFYWWRSTQAAGVIDSLNPKEEEPN